MNSTTAHLQACEASYVMNLTSADRDRFMAKVRAKRGEKAAQELLERARNEWRKQRVERAA